MMKHKEARLCVDHSQSPQLLILHYLVPDTVSKGKGEGEGKGEIKKVFVTFKNGGKGKDLCLCSPHSTSLSDGCMMLFK